MKSVRCHLSVEFRSIRGDTKRLSGSVVVGEYAGPLNSRALCFLAELAVMAAIESVDSQAYG